MKKKILKVFPFNAGKVFPAFFLGIFAIGSAFHLPDEDVTSPLNAPVCDNSIEYDVEIITTYHLPIEDAPKLTQLELARIRNSTERQTIKVCLTQNDHIKEITIHNPEDIFPDWMENLPVRTIIQNSKTEHFNKNGLLIHKRPHKPHELSQSNTKKQRYQAKGMFVDEWYIDSPSAMAAELTATETLDAIFQSSNKVTAEKEATYWDYDFNTNILEKRFAIGSPNNLLIRTQYLEATDASFIPHYTYTEHKEVTKNTSVCFYKTVIYRYSNIVKDGVAVDELNAQQMVFNPQEVIAESLNKNRKTVVKSAISLNPNPANDILNISWSIVEEGSSIKDMLIINSQGQQMSVGIEKNRGNGSQINISDFKTGIYFLQVLFDDGNIITKKFVKQ